MMRNFIALVENAIPYDEQQVLDFLLHSDGMERAREEFRLENGRDPYDVGGDSEEDNQKFQAWYLQWAENRIEEKAYGLGDLIKGGVIRIYRVITAPADWKPDPARHPGIYWSWDKGAAQAHWGEYREGMAEWMMVADVEARYVDWTFTVAHNADFDYEEEKEIRLLPNAPVKMIHVTKLP